MAKRKQTKDQWGFDAGSSQNMADPWGLGSTGGQSSSGASGGATDEWGLPVTGKSSSGGAADAWGMPAGGKSSSGGATDVWGMPVSSSSSSGGSASGPAGFDWGLPSSGSSGQSSDLDWGMPSGSSSGSGRRKGSGKAWLWALLAFVVIAAVVLAIVLTPGLRFRKDPSAADVTPVPTATATPRVTATPRPTATPTPRVTATPRPTATPTPRVTATPRPTATPTPRVTATPRPTATPTPRPTATPALAEPRSQMFRDYPVSTRYFYHMLTDNEKRLFAEFYDGLAECRNKIEFVGDYTLDEYKRVLFVIWYDCPEFFHLSGEDGYHSTYYYYDDKLDMIEVEYSLSKSEFERRYTQIMGIIRGLRNRSDFGSSDFSKQFTVYRYLIENNEYNLAKPQCGMADSAWLLGYAKCSGYTRALNLGLRYYGLQCCEIRGFTEGSDDGHMWTGVKLDGLWYLCDVTWDDPVVSPDSDYDPFQFPVAMLPYLNLPESAMMVGRTLNSDIIFPLPQCTSWKHNYYEMMGARVPAGTNAKTAIHNALTKAYQNGNDYFVLAFANEREYRAAYSGLVDNLKSWRCGSATYGGCSWSYWDDLYIIFVHSIKYR